MYERIGIKELGKRLTGTIARIERGEGRLITRRNRPVACLVPVEKAREAGLLDDKSMPDSQRKQYYRERSRDLFEMVASLGEDAPDYVEALEAEYHRRRQEPDRSSNWAF